MDNSDTNQELATRKLTLENKKLEAEIAHLNRRFYSKSWFWTVVTVLVAGVGQFFWNRLDIEQREIQVATAELEVAQSRQSATELVSRAELMWNQARQAVVDAENAVAVIQSEAQQDLRITTESLREAQSRLAEAHGELDAALPASFFPRGYFAPGYFAPGFFAGGDTPDNPEP